MSETTIKINGKLSELGVYLVNKYSMSPRDAVGMVMQSSIPEEISKPGSEMLSWPVEQIASALI